MSVTWTYRLLSTDGNPLGVGGVVHLYDEDGGMVSIAFPTADKAREFAAVIEAICETGDPPGSGEHVTIRLSVEQNAPLVAASEGTDR